MCKILRVRCGSEQKGTDLFGFSVLPTGFRVSDRLYNKEDLNLLRAAQNKIESKKRGDYLGEGEQALFWTSSEESEIVRVASFEYNYGGIGIEYRYKDNGYSVRCVKD